MPVVSSIAPPLGIAATLFGVVAAIASIPMPMPTVEPVAFRMVDANPGIAVARTFTKPEDEPELDLETMRENLREMRRWARARRPSMRDLASCSYPRSTRVSLGAAVARLADIRRRLVNEHSQELEDEERMAIADLRSLRAEVSLEEE